MKHLNLPTTNKASGGQSEEVKKLKVERQYVEDDMKKLEAELSKMREELNHLKELISDRVLNSQVYRFDSELLNIYLKFFNGSIISNFMLLDTFLGRRPW